MRKFLILLALLCAVHFTYAQSNNITEISRFIISDARINKVDVTENYVNGKAYMVFYKIKGDDNLYFANVWPAKGSQSFGRVYNLERTFKDATDTEYKNETLTFKWSYINDYDKKEGTATIKLGLIYKPNGVVFLMTMLPETLDLSTFKGFVSGTLNLE